MANLASALATFIPITYRVHYPSCYGGVGICISGVRGTYQDLLEVKYTGRSNEKAMSAIVKLDLKCLYAFPDSLRTGTDFGNSRMKARMT